jgi:hypothetical protein
MKKLGFDMSHVGGTAMGLRNAKERSKIPEKLCDYIVDICEGKVRKDAQME